jgi:hypothetical protein
MFGSVFFVTLRDNLFHKKQYRMTFFTANVIGCYSDFFVTLSGVEGSSIASQRSLRFMYIR